MSISQMTCNGVTSINWICNWNGITLNKLYSNNNVAFSKYNSENWTDGSNLKSKIENQGYTTKDTDGLTKSSSVKSYLSWCNKKSKSPVNGLILDITTTDYTTNLYETHLEADTNDLMWSNLPFNYSDYGMTGTNDYPCYFWRIINNELAGDCIPLPTIPQSVSDNNSVTYNGQSFFGRSVAYQTYDTSRRDVSFELTLHQDAYRQGFKTTYDNANDDNIYNIVKLIQSCCYPEYDGTTTAPCEVVFHMGKQFHIRGVLTSCGATWKTPILFDREYLEEGGFKDISQERMAVCELSIGMTETAGPFSQSEIMTMGGYRDQMGGETSTSAKHRSY